MFKKQNPWRFPADFRPRLFVVRGSFFQLFGRSGGLFSSFSVYFLVSFLGLGLLSDNLVSSPEFDRDLDLHFDTLLCHFSTFLPILFSKIFRCFPRPLFSQLSSKMNAFGEPTGSSGDAFSKVFVAKAKSRKVTFCLDRTPYLEIRGGSVRRVASVFSTPALREAPPMEKESRNRFSFGFQCPAATRLGSFSGTILQSRKKL